MSTDGAELGQGAEFDAIRELVARWGDTARGIGDDAAILDVPRGERIVISTDASVEHRHFETGWLSPGEIGYRACTAALSDLAAMAAKPIGVLFAANIPEAYRSSFVSLADGFGDAARAARTHIIGGNLSGAAELAITTTVVGSVYAPLLRSTARVGDRLFVTGRLGGPAAAVEALAGSRQPSAEHRARFARPVARIIEARWLAANGASAGIDVSDGLAGDAAHLAAASGCKVTVRLESVPAMAGVSQRRAVSSGEEYELLVTAAELDVEEFMRQFGVPLTEVGELAEGHGVVVLDRGSEVAVLSGHDHFSKKPGAPSSGFDRPS